MLASLADAPLDDPDLVYEPKYDGIRVIAEVPAGGGSVHLWSRLGNEKTAQFPEIARALSAWSRRRKVAVVLDGELVALDPNGEPSGFQHLQGRIHLTSAESDDDRVRVAYIVFDLLREGAKDYCATPLSKRRAALEAVLRKPGSPLLRISEQVRGDGRALYQTAIKRGWEGLIAKGARSLYRPGKRTPDWRKLKITLEQEFVIGGWTEPRSARAHFGALLLGVYERTRNQAPHLSYVGSVGTGFDDRELTRVMKLLRPLETPDCPFAEKPHANEKPHWARPTLVAQVRFTEWTADNKLRQPVYLGLRDDKDPHAIERERATTVQSRSPARVSNPAPPHDRAMANPPKRAADADATRLAVVERLRELEDARRDGRIDLGGGESVQVTNLHKVFWPKQKLTKGDLFRYYATVAPVLLPVLADRPLVMKRFPDGIAAAPFYQHAITDVPEGIRVERLGADRRQQIVGGRFKTLMYTTQLAAVSQDPWFSRVKSLAFADHVAIDLDPAPGVGFAQVLEVACWVRDELERFEGFGVPKTSGADGLHIYIPLPEGTPYEAGLLYCQIVATVVAHKHPRAATIERSVPKRGRRVYLDYLQNVLGKTLASAYSARASEYAGVSAPLTWDEVERGVRREDFTITSFPARLEAVGDLWAALRESNGVDLSRLTERLSSPTRE